MRESGVSVAFFGQALKTNCIDAWLWGVAVASTKASEAAVFIARRCTC